MMQNRIIPAKHPNSFCEKHLHFDKVRFEIQCVYFEVSVGLLWGGGDFSDLVGERSACKLLLQKFNSEKVFWPGSWWGHFEGSGWGSGEQVDDTKVVKFLWKYRQFEVR